MNNYKVQVIIILKTFLKAGKNMKAIKCDLPYAEQIEVHTLADLHIGDAMADFKLIMERIEYIKNTKNAYCILGGDLMDTAIASSVGDTYGANLKPMEQLKQCVKIFEPIKDKILAVLPGNHENRVYRFDGIDITEIGSGARIGRPQPDILSCSRSVIVFLYTAVITGILRECFFRCIAVYLVCVRNCRRVETNFCM